MSLLPRVDPHVNKAAYRRQLLVATRLLLGSTLGLAAVPICLLSVPAGKDAMAVGAFVVFHPRDNVCILAKPIEHSDCWALIKFSDHMCTDRPGEFEGSGRPLEPGLETDFTGLPIGAVLAKSRLSSDAIRVFLKTLLISDPSLSTSLLGACLGFGLSFPVVRSTLRASMRPYEAALEPYATRFRAAIEMACLCLRRRLPADVVCIIAGVVARTYYAVDRAELEEVCDSARGELRKLRRRSTVDKKYRKWGRRVDALCRKRKEDTASLDLPDHVLKYMKLDIESCAEKLQRLRRKHAKVADPVVNDATQALRQLQRNPIFTALELPSLDGSRFPPPESNSATFTAVCFKKMMDRV